MNVLDDFDDFLLRFDGLSGSYVLMEFHKLTISIPSRSDIKTNLKKKNFFGDFFSVDFWQ